jgi:hypothetical protein
MRSGWQTVALIIVVGGMVAGVAFVRTWMSTSPSGVLTPGAATGMPKPPEEYRLSFPVNRVAENTEFEKETTTHFDFWFHNDRPEAMEIGLEYQSCKCSRAEVFVLTPEEAALHKDLQTVTSSTAGAVAQAVLPVFGESARWQLMDPIEKNPVPVPGNATGCVRLTWKGEKLGPGTLTVVVWVQAAGNPRTRGGQVPLEVAAKCVEPIQVYPPDAVGVPDLRPGQAHTVQAWCWSSTRPQFKLNVKPDAAEPCFVSTCETLQGEELRQAAAMLKEKTNTKALCAYRIKVTVHERLTDGSQMDLGPYQHKVVLQSDLEDVTPVVNVRGIVRGDVNVGTEDDKDKIVLKAFSSKAGVKEFLVPIDTTLNGLKLELQSKSPDYLEVRLEQKGPTHWDMYVSVPPNKLIGKMPVDSAVILKTEGQLARRIRIPVLGKGTLP